ncbi:hypothetical protein GQ457_06G020190 [Hibiscus cannabinus]
MFWKNWTQLPLQEPLLVTDEQNIIKADALFQTFKYMRVDLIISFKDREKNQSLFQKMSDKDAFDVVTIELGYMCDKLYTKETVIYTPPGLIRHITTLLVWFVFCLEDMKKSKKADISLTSLLLLVAVVLEIIAAQVLLFLDQSNLRLIKHIKTSCLKLTHPLQPYFKQNKKKKKWMSRVPQSSLLRICCKKIPCLNSCKR